MAGLDIQVKTLPGTGGAALAELAGAIDGNTVSSFQSALEQVARRGIRSLVIDMSRIQYVNSTGLGALVKHADTFKSAGGGLALFKLPAKVKIVIEMLGLNAFFDICADLDAALALLAQLHGIPAPSVPPPVVRSCPAGHRMEPAWNRCPFCLPEPPRPAAPAGPAPARPAVAELTVRSGKGLGRTWPVFEGKTTVGRAEGCDIRLQDDHVSPQHAEIELLAAPEPVFVVTDLGSASGTFRNSALQPLAREPLLDGDAIAFGRTHCAFRVSRKKKRTS